MEERQFQKLEEWFVQFNHSLEDIHKRMDGLATKQQLENRFDALFVSMRNLLDRFQKLEETFGKQNEEMVIVKLAIKRLEDEIEELRSQVH